MGKKHKQNVITTFIGSDANIEGTIEFQGTIRIDGKVMGKIISDEGTVIVGETAILNAEIIVNAAIIMGEVHGTIDAKERIEVYQPGRVVGDIQSPIISIDTGVMFNGKCAMKARTISSKPPTEVTLQ